MKPFIAFLALSWELVLTCRERAALAAATEVCAQWEGGCDGCSGAFPLPTVSLMQTSFAVAQAQMNAAARVATDAADLSANVDNNDQHVRALITAASSARVVVEAPRPGHAPILCADREDFVDAHGYLCWNWRGLDCEKAESDYGYQRWEQSQLIQNCALSCAKCEPTAADFAGVKANAKGDLEVFITALGTNSLAFITCAGIFMVLSKLYPSMYCNNLSVSPGLKIPDSPFGWLLASLLTTAEQAEATAGLDGALMLTFCELAMKIAALVALPNVLAMIPLHYFRGRAFPADRLSRIAMANVMEDHPWLYWLHVLNVWNVTIVIIGLTRDAQAKFLRRRFRWLAKRPLPVANTIMVTGIEKEWRSDGRLKEFFSKMFDDVQSAYVVKRTQTLCLMIEHRNDFAFKSRDLRLKWEKDGGERPVLRPYAFAPEVDAIQYYEARVKELESCITVERARIKEEASKSVGGSVYSDSGFVTFGRMREAVMANSGVIISASSQRWNITHPPEPNQVVWSELQKDGELHVLKEGIGYFLTAALYFGFVPVCVFVTNLAFEVEVPRSLKRHWAAFAPTLGLLIFVNFLPTVFLLIFRSFFNLKSDRWAQLQLQEWYFWFQIVFVLLVAAVGQSVHNFIWKIVEHPLSLCLVLAQQLPQTTHFYMNYLVLQWLTHGTNLTRYVPLGKFLVFRRIYTEEEARSMAEPEDQDYYGIGGRCARWTILLLIGVVFSTLSPLIGLLAFINFAIARLVYGYLIVFAETPKADLGGVFWVKMLNHVYVGLIIYLILMIGVLTIRPYSVYPMCFTSPALVLAIFMFKRFNDDFRWERLPFEYTGARNSEIEDVRVDSGQVYMQPELDEEHDWTSALRAQEVSHQHLDSDGEGKGASALADKIVFAAYAHD